LALRAQVGCAILKLSFPMGRLVEDLSAEDVRPAKIARRAEEAKKPYLISAEQWQEFRERGYVNLGRVIPDELLERMERRIDAIMMGEVNHGNRLMMQLDPGGAYGDAVQSVQSAGFKGATRAYRKIGEAGFGLECDEVFREAMLLPVFKEACTEMYGGHVDIGIYRSMVFNKPAQAGTDLPWHQDGGEWWGLDRDALIFVWTALDDATKAKGCVKVVPGTHKLGLLSKRGHTLSQESIEAHQVEERATSVEVARGESVLMHNFLIHSSGTNATDAPRRAFSVNYADGRTRLIHPKPVVQPEGKSGPVLGFTEPGQQLPVIFSPELPAF